MITVPYDPKLWLRAADRAAEMPVYENSHRGKQANEVGALGEVIFEYILEERGVPFSRTNATTEDIFIFGKTLDVKTKDRTVEPKPHYECSVPMYNHDHQRPDLYVFVSLFRDQHAKYRNPLESFRCGYIVGWATLDRVDKGKLWRAGEEDPANGTKFWTGCRNLSISQLNSMGRFLARCEELMHGP